MQRRCWRVVLAGLVVAIVADASVVAAAGGILCNRHRVVTRCGLPQYSYGHDDERLTDSTIAVASVDQPTEAKPGAVDGKDAILCKRFVPVPEHASLKIEHLGLSQISLEVRSSGQLACTGLISHDGGPSGELLGANVAVRVRAYAGTPQHPNVDHDAVMLWETTRLLWVPRKHPQVVSLLPAIPPLRYPNGDQVRFTTHTQYPLAHLAKSHFHDVTHLQVELEYRKDR